MKTLISFLCSWAVCLSIFAGLTACYSEIVCEGCDGDLGIIVEQQAGPLTDCQGVLLNPDQQLIITNDSSYQLLSAQFNAGYDLCDSLAFQGVDFDQYSVLSMAVDGSGCSRSFCPKVEKDDLKQEYIFTVKVIECGGCEPLEITRLWVVVPKLPEDYAVRFEKIYERF